MAEEVLPSDVAEVENERGLTMSREIVDQIPLYGAPSLKMGTGHAGLYFDKFCKVLDPKAPGAKADWLKKDFLPSTSTSLVGDAELIREHLERQERLIRAWGGVSFRIKTVERFVTGLGYRHPLENGFAWHPVLGTPYLPGSGLKGLARAWADLNGVAEPEMTEVFGPRGEGIQHAMGSVIFLDALPRQVVKLVVEVMTPHYGPYYQGQGDKAPGDYHDPVPIPFLAVEKGEEFLVGVLPRTRGDKTFMVRVQEWLCEALEQVGAGAKTATGYGRFAVPAAVAEKKLTHTVTTSKPAEQSQAPEPTTLPAVFKVKFVDFAEAREARKTARERQKKGKEPKFREFDVRPTNPGFAKLAGKVVCSSRDTVGYDLPFEEAERHAGAQQPFYVGNLEERDGKKVVREILLTKPQARIPERP